MKLSRRDAIGALWAAGVGSIAGCGSLTESKYSDDDREMATLLALADVLYPSEIEVERAFVETYLYGRIVDEESYREEVVAGVETLDERAEDQYDMVFRALEVHEREALLSDLGGRSVDSVPDGSALERLHYHLVDELLFAFYASPTGGELVGDENPVGYPGGVSPYPRGSDA